MIYVPSTEKLGIVVKDAEGKYVEGYILKDIKNNDNLIDTHSLSSAIKYGEISTLDNSFEIKSINKEIAVIKIQDKLVPMKINTKASSAIPGWCDRLCNPTSEEYDWDRCFLCCLVSPSC